MKTALLAVSVGTTVPQAREEILRVEQVLAAQWPSGDFFRAFTGSAARIHWARQGESVDRLPEALERLEALGYSRVLVQPTHLLCGAEYDRIQEEVSARRNRFALLALGKPLIAGTEELLALAKGAARLPEEGETLILLGHGTDHAAGMAYPALQTAFRLIGSGALVGTVMGWPGFPEVLAQLEAGACRQILLVPLMLAAGKHILRDMAGGEAGSWKSRLEAAGYAVRCRTEGLGSLPEVQAIYRRHLKELTAAHGL